MILDVVAAGPLFDGALNLLTDFIQSEVAKMTIAFMLAARLHRQWVRKDMAEQFSKITASIDKVADRLALDLSQHSSQIKDLSTRMTNVENHVVRKRVAK